MMHQKISVAVDVLIFTIEDDMLKIALTEREAEPYKGMYALPYI